MPLTGYGVLVGSAVDRRREGGGGSPHYQVRLNGAGVDYRVAVNVLSQQAPSELLFLAVDTFSHPLLDLLLKLPDGMTGLPSEPGSGALDFVRANLFDPAEMRPIPPDLPGPDNDLADRLEHYVQRAVADPSARVYAFGQRWGPDAGQPDPVFGFSPGNGIHDIHMNQGNSGSFVRDDGVWQDGAILFRFQPPGSPPQWSAVFLAFQSQSWHTDDRTGHTLEGPTPVGRPVVRVVAALVNPRGPAPERETVTLLNLSPDPVDLTGWTLADAAKHQFPLAGSVAAGSAAAVPVAPPFQLGNGGGAVTLLDAAGNKVDGVAYSAAEAGDEGWTVVFPRSGAVASGGR
jgi:uncharacterized protein YukJ